MNNTVERLFETNLSNTINNMNDETRTNQKRSIIENSIIIEDDYGYIKVK
jgi:hypothetical protein